MVYRGGSLFWFNILRSIVGVVFFHVLTNAHTNITMESSLNTVSRSSPKALTMPTPTKAPTKAPYERTSLLLHQRSLLAGAFVHCQY